MYHWGTSSYAHLACLFPLGGSKIGLLYSVISYRISIPSYCSSEETPSTSDNGSSLLWDESAFYHSKTSFDTVSYSFVIH